MAAMMISTLHFSLVSSILFFSLLKTSTVIHAESYNVVNFGASPDGDQSDSSTPFLNAWNAACNSPKPAAAAAAIYVPPGRFLLGKTVIFSGPCSNARIDFKIDGTLVAPSDYNDLGNSKGWILFDRVNGVSIVGGTLDGQGSTLWDCKLSGKLCPVGATTLEFMNSNNITITGLTSVNSQLFHIVFNGCQIVKLQDLIVMAAKDSPNTDGIHVQLSSNITILRSNIGTGDDCISIGPGTTNLWIQNVTCGPGHGISIGSLAKEYEESGVQNVTLKNVTFVNTQNGARIKAWGRRSTGFVKDFRVHHCRMINVRNPIIIDQNYCPYESRKECPGPFSGVKISNVTYKGIHGTSATEVAVKFDCSKTDPCSGIILENVKLKYKHRKSKAECSNAAGTAIGSLMPRSCF